MSRDTLLRSPSVHNAPKFLRSDWHRNITKLDTRKRVANRTCYSSGHRSDTTLSSALTYALNYSTKCLSLDNHGIDHLTHVINCRITRHFHCPRIRIDLDFA